LLFIVSLIDTLLFDLVKAVYPIFNTPVMTHDGVF